jgi:hypothetical protein
MSNQESSTSNISVSPQQSNIRDKIKSFLEINDICVHILTPCYGGQCFSSYTTSLLKTALLLKELNIKFIISFMANESLISRGRNNLIARAMLNEKTTHFFFIDSDISWKEDDVLKLILMDKSLCGGVYPRKKYNWEKINNSNVEKWIEKKNTINSNIQDENIIRNNLLSYNINHINNTINIANNITKVRHLATGFMMIKRHVIEDMIQKFPELYYVDDTGYLNREESKYTYSLFDCGIIENHYYSEDWLFCHRWTSMGGDIFVDISIDLTHTGTESYEGSLLLNLLTN